MDVLIKEEINYEEKRSIVTYSPVEVPITTQSFIFVEAFGSIGDNFDDIFADLDAFLTRSGAISSRRAILYLDYGVDRIHSGKFKSAMPPSDRSMLDYLKDIYGESTLKTHRRVLVGYLVPPQYYISPDDHFKKYVFSNLKALAFQSMDSNIRTPLSVLTAPPGSTTTVNENNAYSQVDRLYDKLNMMNFLALHVESSKNIGMMEMYDERLDVYTFMAIPGDQAAFLTELGIPLSAAPGSFTRRADVVIKERDPSQGAAPAEAAPAPAESAPIAVAP
jgi:hypothetical protein